MAMNDKWYILIRIIPNDKISENNIMPVNKITDIKNYIVCGYLYFGFIKIILTY